jgi:hypothetical protein
MILMYRPVTLLTRLSSGGGLQAPADIIEVSAAGSCGCLDGRPRGGGAALSSRARDLVLICFRARWPKRKYAMAKKSRRNETRPLQEPLSATLPKYRAYSSEA